MGKHKNSMTEEHRAKIVEAAKRREAHRRLDRHFDSQDQNRAANPDQKSSADPLVAVFASTPNSPASLPTAPTPSAATPAPVAQMPPSTPDPKRLIAEAFKHFRSNCSISETLANMNVTEAQLKAALVAEGLTLDTVKEQASDAGRARLKIAAQEKGERGDARLIQTLQADAASHPSSAKSRFQESIDSMSQIALERKLEDYRFRAAQYASIDKLKLGPTVGRAHAYGWQENPKYTNDYESIWLSYDPKQPRYRNPFRECPVCGHPPTCFLYNADGTKLVIPPHSKPYHPFIMPEDITVTICPPDKHGSGGSLQVAAPASAQTPSTQPTLKGPTPGAVVVKMEDVQQAIWDLDAETEYIETEQESPLCPRLP